MKKLILPVVSLILFTLVSCLDSGKGQTDSLEPGRQIYANAYSQHFSSMLPVDMAFKLNTLLTEADSQDKDIAEVKVSVDGKTQNLVSYYYGNNTVVTELDGTYKVAFDNGTFGGRQVHGLLVVHTGGKRLGELGAGDSWSVELKSNGSGAFKYWESETMIWIDDAVKYDISAATGGGWDITFTDYQARYTDAATSDWAGSFTLVQTDGSGMGFHASRNSTFELSGSASGKTMNGYGMTFEIVEGSPLMYIPTCGDYFVSGTVRSAFTDKMDEDYFPSDFSVVAIKYSGDCEYFVTLTYNGKSGDFS